MHYPQQTQYPQALLRVSWRRASSRPGCAPDFGTATHRSLEHPEICTCFVIGVAARWYLSTAFRPPEPAAPVQLARGRVRAPAPVHRRAGEVRAGQGPAVNAGGRLHQGAALGHRGRAGADVRGRQRPRDYPCAHRRGRAGRARADPPCRPAGRPDRAAVHPGGAAEGRTGGRRGPDRAADALYGQGDRGLPAGTAVARAGADVAGAVAVDPESRAGDRRRTEMGQ